MRTSFYRFLDGLLGQKIRGLEVFWSGNKISIASAQLGTDGSREHAPQAGIDRRAARHDPRLVASSN